MTATDRAPQPIMTFRTGGDAPPLPLLPVWRRMHAGEGRMWILYTAFRATLPTGSEALLVGGVNQSTIYDFCGGCFVTSFNARCTPINRNWMEADARRRVDAVPDIAAYLGDDWYAQVMAAYGEHPAVGAGYSTQQGLPGMLARLVGASVFARMILTAGAANQNIVSFWDKTSGSTRAWIKYGTSLFRERPVRAPRPYALQNSRSGTWGSMDAGMGAGSLFAGHGAQSVPADLHRTTEVTTVRVSAYGPGRSQTNRNSGNSVSAGALFLDSAADYRANGTLIGFTPTAILRTLDRDFCGGHINDLAAVPTGYWFSMG